MKGFLKKKLIVFGITILMLISSFSLTVFAFDFDVASKSVFIILSGDVYGDENASLGSGFAIDNNHIVTNAHVIADEYNIVVGTYSETAELNIGDEYKAELVAIDREIDIAVLRVQDTSLTPLEVADAKTIKEGDDVFAIGAPEGLPYTLTKGTVSSKLREINGVKYVQTDAAINQGNSGGPLMNEDNEVIGINTLKSSTSENIGFAIRIDFVLDYIEQEKIGDSSSGSGSIIPSLPDSSDFDYDFDEDFDYDLYRGNDNSYIIYIVLVIVIVAGLSVFLILKFTLGNKSTVEPDIPIADNLNNKAGTVPLNQADKNLNLSGNKLKSPVTNAGLCILSGNMRGAKFNLINGKDYTVGKDRNIANIIVDTSYSKVSRVHCTISYNADFNKYFVTDCSSNGTYYENGIRLAKGRRVPVERGLVLKLADEGCIVKLI